jgi:hypothetical protein
VQLSCVALLVAAAMFAPFNPAKLETELPAKAYAKKKLVGSQVSVTCI